MKNLPILLLFVLLGTSTTNAQAMSMEEITKSYSKIKSGYDKLLGKVKPWQDMVNQNLTKLPADWQSKYQAFNTRFTEYSSMLSGFDPTKVTDMASATSTIDKLKSGLTDLNSQYKDLSSQAKKLGIKV